MSPLLVVYLPESAVTAENIDGVDHRPPIVDAAGHLQIDVLSTALAATAATAAKQTTMITALQLIDNLVTALTAVGTDQLRVDLISWPALGAPDNGATTVGNSSTEVLAANADRKYACLVNDSDEEIYLGLGAAAVLNEGIRLNRGGGAWWTFGPNLYAGVINAICASGGKELTRVEA